MVGAFVSMAKTNIIARNVVVGAFVNMEDRKCIARNVAIVASVTMEDRKCVVRNVMVDSCARRTLVLLISMLNQTFVVSIQFTIIIFSKNITRTSHAHDREVNNKVAFLSKITTLGVITRFLHVDR